MCHVPWQLVAPSSHLVHFTAWHSRTAAKLALKEKYSAGYLQLQKEINFSTYAISFAWRRFLWTKTVVLKWGSADPVSHFWGSAKSVLEKKKKKDAFFSHTVSWHGPLLIFDMLRCTTQLHCGRANMFPLLHEMAVKLSLQFSTTYGAWAYLC